MNLIGDLPGYGMVLFDPKAIANILSLKIVQSRYHAVYNSKEGKGFIVTKSNGDKLNLINPKLGCIIGHIKRESMPIKW